jgi:hypothetical protein
MLAVDDAGSVGPARLLLWQPHMRGHLVWKVGALSLVGGCSTAAVNFARVNPPPVAMSQRPPEEVAVYSSGPPCRPHLDVGVIEAKSLTAGWQRLESLMAMARKEAGRRGCDALVLNPVAFTGTDGDLRVVSGTCVVFVPATNGR